MAYHLPLFNVKSPGSVNAFNNFFDQLASFDFLDTEKPNNDLFYIPELEPISLNF